MRNWSVPAEEWKSALIDLTSRNNLLRYRDLQHGTLDLALMFRAPSGMGGETVT